MTETVMVRTATNQGRTVYHTTECRLYPDDPHEMPLQSAEASGLTECQYCSGEFVPHTDSGGLPQWVQAAIDRERERNHV